MTILALIILFAVYAFIDAGFQAMRAFSSPAAGPVFGHLLLALIALAAGGVVTLVWPGPTALVLVLVAGIWAFAGVVLFARPRDGAVTLALLSGFFSLMYGGSQIVSGVQLRRTLHAVLPEAA